MKRKYNILLVDDDDISNFINRQVISSLNIAREIDVAHNGEEALQFLQRSLSSEKFPQLIFLDLNMPIMDGFEFLERFKKMNIEKDIKVFILSSSAHEADLKKAASLKVQGYLTKPITEEQASECIEEVEIKREDNKLA